MQFGLSWILPEGAHDGAQFFGGDRSIAVLVEEGERLLELCLEQKKKMKSVIVHIQSVAGGVGMVTMREMLVRVLHLASILVGAVVIVLLTCNLFLSQLISHLAGWLGWLVGWGELRELVSESQTR